MTTNLKLFLCLCLMVHVFSTALVNAKKEETNSKEHKDAFYKSILDDMRANNIRDDLKNLTMYPHHPGSERNKVLAKEMAKSWKQSGFDKTQIFKYNIYMSYPKAPGEIILRRNKTIVKSLTIDNEPVMDESESLGKPVYPFNAYSPSGHVTAKYVYVNYARTSDFTALKKRGVSVKGKIVVSRYGKTARSAKVRRAEQRGAVGVILYSDPYDYTYKGHEYPKGWMLNKHGIQRGTINRLSGDALSIGYPSKPGYFRINETKYSGNPKIPSQPVSYATAYEILRTMTDDSIVLPNGFQGGLNVTYALQSGRGRTLTLKVSTILETRESLTVCTTLNGREEPDRYVMLGNHRDSWTYGASDPSSGTAAMMEIIRTLGEKRMKDGWRPRRSVMACSWGAEEVGILGSTEWTDEHHQFIMNHVVSYLNVDMAVEGNFTVRLKALRFVSEGIYRAAKIIQSPHNENETLYFDWLKKSIILNDGKKLALPKLITPRSGSDYKAFWHTYGTTISDFRYLFSKKDYPRLPANGHYHTRYESFGWMSKHVDPEFKYHLTVSRLMGGHLLILADSEIIPFNLISYTQHIRYYLLDLEKAYAKQLTRQHISLAFAKERLNVLIEKTKQFHIYVKQKMKATPYELRSINDKIMNFERNFLIKGISKTISARHVVWASNSYQLKSTRFPGISEAIYWASKNASSDWDGVRKQITLVVWCFDTANKSLDFDEWSH